MGVIHAQSRVATVDAQGLPLRRHEQRAAKHYPVVVITRWVVITWVDFEMFRLVGELRRSITRTYAGPTELEVRLAIALRLDDRRLLPLCHTLQLSYC